MPRDDIPTPPDPRRPMPPRRPLPATGRAPGSLDDPRAVRDAESLERRRLAQVPPPLPRRTSQPDSDPPDDVTKYRVKVLERDLVDALERIENLDEQVAAMGKLESTTTKASGDQSWRNSIIAGAVSLVLGLVGSRAVAPEAKENKTEVIKSQAEVESELCKKLGSQQEKDICLTGVLTRLIEPAKR